MVVVSGTSEFGKPFVHVFGVDANSKEEARHAAIEDMNNRNGVLKEYRKNPFDPEASNLVYRIEYLVPSN